MDPHETQRDRSGPRALALVAVLALLFACAPDQPQPKGQGSELSEAEIQRLESLGYLGFAPKPDRKSASNVIVRKEGCSCDGFYLLTYPALGRADLVTAKGRTVRTWDGAPETWERAVFTPDGGLLVLAGEKAGDEPGQRRRVLVRLGFDGERLWKRVLPVHHFAEVMDDGRIAVLTSRSKEVPELFGDLPAIDNGFAILSPDGERVEDEWSLYEMLAKRPDILELKTFEEIDPKLSRDFLHANFFQRMPGGALAERDPLYSAGNVLVTLRRQDALVVFDLAASEVVWAWGPGEVVGLHEATVLENGHILLFDNRNRAYRPQDGDGWSRVVELDPISREIVWEYRADPPEDFYSHSRGTVTRLDGGNTLICSSNQGRIFEVTPDGDVVWEYRTSHRDEKGHRAVVRAQRYSKRFVGPLLRAWRSNAEEQPGN